MSQTDAKRHTMFLNLKNQYCHATILPKATRRSANAIHLCIIGMLTE